MSEENFAADAYKYIVEYAKLAYEKDLRRQDSIIQQASHMQTAFSFMTAALFMAATLLVEHCSLLSNWFYLYTFGSVTFVLLASLFAATMAQNRKKSEAFANAEDFRHLVEDDFENFLSEEQRMKHLAQTYEKVQKDLCTRNDNALVWIKISMWAFYLALGLIGIFFTAAMLKIL